jgi:hypothetical protein
MSNGAEMISRVLGSVMLTTGFTSTLDSVEQFLRIALLLVSLATGLMFIVINHKKVISIIRKWFNACPED